MCVEGGLEIRGIYDGRRVMGPWCLILHPRSQQHAKVVPWMRKTEYISTEFNRYGISNEKPEVK